MSQTKLSPGMQQYVDMKKDYPDAFLFFRMGDFYELFYEDATRAAQILEISITSRNKNAADPIPMAGVPYHSAQQYIDTLIEQGYKVAIAEQMEDPKQAKGLVKREVTRIVTPGTNLNIQGNEEERNHFIMSIAYFQGKTGISIGDVTTGDYYLTEVEDNKKLLDEINKYTPREIICNDAFQVSGIAIAIQK